MVAVRLHLDKISFLSKLMNMLSSKIHSEAKFPQRIVTKISRRQKILLTILATSLILRIILIFSGGQYFWPDEDRYENSRIAAEQLLVGNKRGAVETLHTAVNPLFGALGVLPAIVESIFTANLRIPALFFSLFSVLNLWLLRQIVLSLGGGEQEAVFAMFLLALSSTFFYYSRHLLPYDTAMAFGLLSILFGIKNPHKIIHSLLSGLLSLCAFLVYTGYWFLVVFSLIAHAFFATRQTIDNRQKRVTLFGTAFALPLLAILVLSNFLFDEPLLDQFLFFSGKITQGDYSEGWSLPFEYLWHAEHLILIFWIASFVFCLWKIQRGEKNERVIFGLTGILFIYLSLVTFSVVVEKFVVYGRLARSLVPFLCILGAFTLERFWVSNRNKRRIVKILILSLSLQAVLNFYPPFVQDFPIEFLKKSSSISASFEEDQFQILYASMIYPEPDEVLPNQPYKVLLQSNHPLEFLPYQYEGYTPAQRYLLRSNDITMRLIVFETK